VEHKDSNFQAIFNAAPYGMVLIDAAGTMSTVNQRLCEKFGYAPHELIGQPIEMLLPERYRTGHRGLRDGYFQAPSKRSMGLGRDLTALRKDGTEFPVEIGLSSVVGEAGTRVLAAIVNITERKRAERALHEANAQLEEFTYVSSHDLRAPVRGIGNLLEWIREDVAAGELQNLTKNLDRMDMRIRKLDRLIEDLAVYARASKRSSRIELIDLGTLIQEILDLEAVPPHLRVELDIEVKPFMGTPTPLTTVLRNLIGNAVKHHDKPSGFISITAREAGNNCLVAVTDDGPGIPSNARERVFRLFQTLSAGDGIGSGLGLAIAKRLVEGHGGSIALTSPEGRTGCTFSVFWPRFMRSDLDE
jgi:PAS domain S-box-containing protein